MTDFNNKEDRVIEVVQSMTRYKRKYICTFFIALIHNRSQFPKTKIHLPKHPKGIYSHMSLLWAANLYLHSFDHHLKVSMELFRDGPIKFQGEEAITSKLRFPSV